MTRRTLWLVGHPTMPTSASAFMALHNAALNGYVNAQTAAEAIRTHCLLPTKSTLTGIFRALRHRNWVAAHHAAPRSARGGKNATGYNLTEAGYCAVNKTLGEDIRQPKTVVEAPVIPLPLPPGMPPWPPLPSLPPVAPRPGSLPPMHPQPAKAGDPLADLTAFRERFNAYTQDAESLSTLATLIADLRKQITDLQAELAVCEKKHSDLLQKWPDREALLARQQHLKAVQAELFKLLG